MDHNPFQFDLPNAIASLRDTTPPDTSILSPAPPQFYCTFDDEAQYNTFTLRSIRSANSNFRCLLIPDPLRASQILDLSPNTSFIQALSELGLSVDLLDWNHEAMHINSLDFSALLENTSKEVNFDSYDCIIGVWHGCWIANALPIIGLKVLMSNPQLPSLSTGGWGHVFSHAKELLDHFDQGTFPSHITKGLLASYLPFRQIQHKAEAHHSILPSNPELFDNMERWLSTLPDLPTRLIQECITLYEAQSPLKTVSPEMNSTDNVLNVICKNDRMIPASHTRSTDPNTEKSLFSCGHLGIFTQKTRNRKLANRILKQLIYK